MGAIKEFKVSRYSHIKDESHLEVEVSVKARGENDLELILQGVEKLVESIDLKHKCDENYEVYQKALKRIVYSVADNLGFEGDWYFVDPNIEMSYNEETEGYNGVSDKTKKHVIKALLDKRDGGTGTSVHS